MDVQRTTEQGRSVTLGSSPGESVAPNANANLAWVQHMVHTLAPRGTAGVVLANGPMSSSQSGERRIRLNMIESVRVDCMVALPGMYSAPEPDSLLPVLPGAREHPAKRCPVHRRDEARSDGQPGAPEIDWLGNRPDRGHLLTPGRYVGIEP